MQIALGILRLAPREFWAMTVAEFWAAHEGYLLTLPKLPSDAEKIRPKLWTEIPTREEILYLKRIHKVA